MTNTSLILHVKGTDQTTCLPKQVVRAGIAQGQITRSQLIWSQDHNEWKQVRELPDLLPSQRLAPAPDPHLSFVLQPRVVATGSDAPARIPRISTPLPRPRNPSAGATSEGVIPLPTPPPAEALDSVAEEEDDGFGPMRWICGVISALIFIALVVNYLLVDRPFTSRFSQTSYGNVAVFAHLGAFVQPRDLVIHTWANPKVTPKKLINFLIVLAHSTPVSPFTKEPFERVSLTTSLMNHYTISGFAWNELGNMAKESEAQQKTFLLDQMTDSSGGSLIIPDPRLNDAAQEANREKVWQDFVAYFTRS